MVDKYKMALPTQPTNKSVSLNEPNIQVFIRNRIIDNIESHDAIWFHMTQIPIRPYHKVDLIATAGGLQMQPQMKPRKYPVITIALHGHMLIFQKNVIGDPELHVPSHQIQIPSKYLFEAYRSSWSMHSLSGSCHKVRDAEIDGRMFYFASLIKS